MENQLTSLLSLLIGLACAGLMMAAYFAPAAWAVGDAQKRGQAGGLVVLLFWLFGPLSALVWLAVRPSTQLIKIAPTQYSDPEDALVAAARLDQLGEWDAATALYEEVAQRWPEHSGYVAACIQQIKQKRAIA